MAFEEDVLRCDEKRKCEKNNEKTLTASLETRRGVLFYARREYFFYKQFVRARVCVHGGKMFSPGLGDGISCASSPGPLSIMN